MQYSAVWESATEVEQYNSSTGQYYWRMVQWYSMVQYNCSTLQYQYFFLTMYCIIMFSNKDENSLLTFKPGIPGGPLYPLSPGEPWEQ